MVPANCQTEFFYAPLSGPSDFSTLRAMALASGCSQQVENCEGYGGDPIAPEWDGLTGAGSIIDASTGYVLEII